MNMPKGSYIRNMAGTRTLWALVPLMLSSCSLSGPSSWQFEQVTCAKPAYGSARMFLAPANEYAGLELEFLQSSEGLKLFLNVFGLEIPAQTGDSEHSCVYISFKDHSYNFPARRFTGGQRLLIPLHVQDEIISYLQDGQPVFIQVGRYKADIYPDKFGELFQRMIRY